jgi:hypothetical protein
MAKKISARMANAAENIRHTPRAEKIRRKAFESIYVLLSELLTNLCKFSF